ncbi:MULTISPECIES: hypothetical protein [unclassified Paraburkholderia]|uniref:hypothetical protein n=1 Tax=unclassified Paraburkholderia TaxID=2615204 RepID=UPI002AB015B6|nr:MULTISPECIES: hypothetical protein [unclassified Paraburkholderia]
MRAESTHRAQPGLLTFLAKASAAWRDARRFSMNFGLLLPQLPQTQHTLHPDVIGARQRAPATPPCRSSKLAARWRDLRERMFRGERG